MLRTWLTAWLALSALGVLWAVANPIGNSPDEPSQVARAAALVRGHPIGREVAGPVGAYTTVHVPRTYDLQADGPDGPYGPSGPSGAHNCYHFLPDLPASCETITSSGASVVDVTYMGRYPPLYYAVVGLPSLITTSETGIYLMRIMSVLFDSAFLALAIMTARRWSSSPLLVAAVWVVTTPTAVFMNASVNASGLEIASATCVWVSGAVMVIDHGLHRPPGGLVAVVASSTAVLALTRPISLLWVGLIVLTLAAVGWGRVRLSEWWQSQTVAFGVAAVVIAVYVAATWVAAAHGLDVVPESPPAAGTPNLRILASSISAVWTGLGQAPGTFGWLDTREPEVAVMMLVVAAGIPVALTFVGSSRRYFITLAGLLVAAVVIPVVLVAAATPRDGLESQGRYFMPFWVGVPLLAAALQQSMPRWAARRINRLMIGPPVIAMFLAFSWNLHRVAVGQAGPWFPWDLPPGSWIPPIPATVLDLMCLVVVTATGLFFLRLSTPLPPGAD